MRNPDNEAIETRCSHSLGTESRAFSKLRNPVMELNSSWPWGAWILIFSIRNQYFVTDTEITRNGSMMMMMMMTIMMMMMVMMRRRMYPDVALL